MPKITILIAIALVFFTVPNSFAVEPEFLEVTEVELIKVTEPEFMEVTEFEFMEASEPEFSEPFVDVDGSTKRGGKPKSVEQIMCGPSNGLPTPKKCLFEGQ